MTTGRDAMRWSWLIAVIALARPARAQPAPCVTDFAVAQDAALDGDRVAFCDDRSKHASCFAVELATGKLAAARRPTRAPGPLASVTVHGKLATACRPDGTACKTLKPTAYVDDGLGMIGVANAAGTRVALINTSEIETFDRRTGKRIAGFRAGKASCTLASFVADDTLLVHNAECGGGQGTSWLATTRGARLAVVGDDQPIDAMAPVLLGANRAAFVSARGDALVVHDVATGKLEKRIALGPASDDARPVLVGDAHRLAIVFGGARWGDVAVVELATDRVTLLPGHRCPR